MARQRFIHPSLWSDPTLGQLALSERLLFVGCFSNADDEGRLIATPAYLRATIFPYDDLTLKDIQQMRDHMASVCRNLVIYTVDGTEYIAFTKWARYQKPRFPQPSSLPAPPGLTLPKTTEPPSQTPITVTLPQDDGKATDTLPQDNGMGLGLGKGLGMDRDRDREEPEKPTSPENFFGIPETPEAEPDCSAHERETLSILKSVQGYKYKWAEDLAFIRDLATDFPKLDILGEAKAWKAYKRDKPLQAKSNPRSQFRNWCRIDSEKPVNKSVPKGGVTSENDPYARFRDVG